MDAITSAAKHIQQYYLTGALKGNLGRAGRVNVQGEDVMRMDQIANQIAIHYLKASGRVIFAASEESKELISINPERRPLFRLFRPAGRLVEPSPRAAGRLPVRHRQAQPGRPRGRPPAGRKRLHRRRNVRHSHRRLHPRTEGRRRLAVPDRRDDDLRPARGGSSCPKTRRPGSCRSTRRTATPTPSRVQQWITENESKYAFRYLGALAGDFHRLLTNGGMFMYPAIVNHPDPKKNHPQGKLRLMYEAAVVAFMCREAGGLAVDESGNPILDIQPQSHHQRTALYVGSKRPVEEIARILRTSE